MDGPICSHEYKGVVRSADGDSYATANTCDLPACIDEAKAWVNRMTFSRTAEYIADGA